MANESKPIPKAAPAQQKTILAIGAHYDDCPFGIPGILLQALRRHYRVVILNIIGDYAGWAPVKGRARELVDLSIRLAAERGIEMKFLGHASMRFTENADTQHELASIVAEVRPDIAFMLWHRDRHPDHEVAAAISLKALRQPAAILGRDDVRAVGRIFAYDNGPGHTIGFEPNAFVNVTAEFPAAMEWLGKLMAFVRGRPYEPGLHDPALNTKETLARYRGMTCGVKYAEAVWASGAYPTEIL